MSTHTPGPWVAALSGADAIVKCLDGRSFTIGDRLYHQENDANARLIASAPELLEACEAATRCLESIQRNQEPVLRALRTADPGLHAAALSMFEGWRRNLEHARAVVAKAKGTA